MKIKLYKYNILLMTWQPVGIDGVFFISAGTLVTGFLGLCIKHILRSKCEHFNCCFGLISIDRRVDLELQAEMKEMEKEENKTDTQMKDQLNQV
jgi:hypothetical protein